MQRSAPARPGRTVRSLREARPPVPRPIPRRGRDRGALYRLLASLLVVVALVVLAVTLYEWGMDGSIYPGVRLGGVDVSGLSRYDAYNRLVAARNVAGGGAVTLQAGTTTWHVSPARLGYTLDVHASVDRAYELGRTGNLVERLRDQGHLLLHGRALALNGHYDAVALRAYVRGVAARLDQAPRPAALTLSAAGPRLTTTARDGLRLDADRATARLATALGGGQTTVRLPTTATPPAISTAAAWRESSRLARLLGAHIAVTANGHTWRLSRSDIAGMLRVTAVQHGTRAIYADAPDRDAVTAYVWQHAGAVDRPGRDAGVAYAGGVVRTRPGHDGRVVDRGAAVAQLAEAVTRGVSRTLTWPIVNGPTVSNEEAASVAARLRRVLRTTVVWLPQRHWAIAPSAIAAALTLRRVPAIGGARLVPHLDAAAIAAHLPESSALAYAPARNAAVVRRGNRRVVIPALAGHHANYVALAAEMLRAPAGDPIYHLPIAVDAPTASAAQAEAPVRQHK